MHCLLAMYIDEYLDDLQDIVVGVPGMGIDEYGMLKYEHSNALASLQAEGCCVAEQVSFVLNFAYSC